MKVAIIGAGKLGVSITEGLIRKGNYTHLYLTRRKVEKLKVYAAHPNITITSDNSKAVLNSDIIILAVLPYQLTDVLRSIHPLISTKHSIISTVTGFEIEQIEDIIGCDKAIIRALPNIAISIGKSMTCVCRNTTSKSKNKSVEQVFKPLGPTMEITEESMNATIVLCSSGIAFWMRLIRATIQGGVQIGLEVEEAQHLAVQTCLGAANLLAGCGTHPEVEIDKVTTPSGCTISGLNTMEKYGLSTSLIKGIEASYQHILETPSLK